MPLVEAFLRNSLSNPERISATTFWILYRAYVIELFFLTEADLSATKIKLYSYYSQPGAPWNLSEGFLKVHNNSVNF